MVKKKRKKLLSLLLCLTVIMSMVSGITLTAEAKVDSQTLLETETFDGETVASTWTTLISGNFGNGTIAQTASASSTAGTPEAGTPGSKVLRFDQSGQGNSRYGTISLPETYTNDYLEVSFDWYGYGIETADGNSIFLQDSSGNDILELRAAGDGRTDRSGYTATRVMLNDVAIGEYNIAKWYTINAKLNFITKEIISFSLTPYGKSSETTLSVTNTPFISSNASNLSRIYIYSQRYGKFEIDNFTVKTPTLYTTTFNLSDDQTPSSNIAGAEITIMSPNGNEYPAITTNDSGTAAINLPAGEYKYIIKTPQGYKPITTPVNFTVSDDSSQSITIEKVTEALVPTSIVISGGQEALTKDIGETATAAQFTAVVYDQFGAPMDSEEVDWSITPSIEGVSIANGVVTVLPNVPAGTITIKATSKTKSDVSATATLTLINTTDITIKYYLADGSSFKDDSIVEDLVIGSTYNLTPAQLAGKLIDTTAYAFDPNNNNNTTKTGAYTVQANGIVNVYFAPLSGTYYVYETFENGFTGEWGFEKDDDCDNATKASLEGTNENHYINASPAELPGDNNDPYGYLYKTFEASVTNQSNIKLVFDFNPMVEKTKGRDANIVAADAKGNVIFSINQHGQNGLKYIIGNNEAVSFGGQNDLNIWYTVEAEIDFNTRLMNLSIKTKDTSVSKVNITKESFSGTMATNLAIFKVGGGYSAAPVYLDNFAISQGSPVRPEPIHQVTVKDKAIGDHKITVTFSNVSDLDIKNAVAIVALYDSQGALVDIRSNAIANLAAGTDTAAMEFTFDDFAGVSTYKIFCWNTLNDMVPLMSDARAIGLE